MNNNILHINIIYGKISLELDYTLIDIQDINTIIEDPYKTIIAKEGEFYLSKYGMLILTFNKNRFMFNVDIDFINNYIEEIKNI